ncbi:exodeoxyribonuclease VII large subunit [Acinetobacter sp. V91_7]|uniref:exodeoxyribonuclease VII large subunit n=1 Tax=unclassified Acinetobacter TaxID=196816 RepID=UPI00287E2984|nr:MULTISPECIES: exodeoxyribonuclease VII large subunit [unclassified Acinetobacter]MDS7933537.1 exodeoxyribonuclease VII large subunit [Acinetobacter sp. V91_4B]MDS7965141.1 exodeoxyribonuclease VII large subunit [Acinetobacter sp. V91_7]MDS8027652.1 exodeoxyribonuclease VII large subunit [Acinetobacter sp. V91_13]
MNQNFLPTFTVSDLHNFLNDTLNACIAQRKQGGQLFCVRGILKNVEQAVENSKWALVYDLIIQDITGTIEVEISKHLLSSFKNGSYVEIQGVPTFNFFREQCTKRLKGYTIRAIEEDSAIQAFQSKLSTLDALKKYRPKSQTFPSQFDLSVAVIYSSATKDSIQEDFYDYLKEYRDEFNFDEKPVSLSNVEALSQAISSCTDHDIVVIIRGGGSKYAFDIFNEEKVLNAFSNLKGYRIVGLGHNPDLTLLDFLADHSVITPTAAGVHLKGQFDELFARNHTLTQQKTQILKLQNDLKTKNDDVIALSANLKQLSDRTDIQSLMNENKSLVELNHELKQQVSNRRKDDETNKRGSVMMFIIAVVAVIAGAVLGRLM